MNCLWKDITEPDAEGWRKVQCVRCGKRGASPYPHDRIISTCLAESDGQRLPAQVGDELHKLIAQLGITPHESCDCAKWIRKMNQWGPDGCDQHLPEICEHLQEAYKATSWAGLTAASLAALTSGLAFQLDWTDPIPSLVKLAIARARKP